MPEHGRTDSSGASAAPPVIIKKYPNRRLYDTARSQYVTLDGLRQMVCDGVDFTVQDARTGADITRSALAQIIMEAEVQGSNNLLPLEVLRQFIRLYEDGARRAMLPDYLTASLKALSGAQAPFPLAEVEEMSRRNMALLEQTFQAMAAPFTGAQAPPPAPEPSPSPAPDAPTDAHPTAESLQRQLDALQRQVQALQR